MVHVQKWSHRDLPTALQWQAVSFIRTQWPSIDGGLIREAYPSALEPTYYTVSDSGELLLSMAATFEAPLSAAGELWAAVCLGNVFTFPAARRRGLGRLVVKAATRDIRASQVDVGALLCDATLQAFYQSQGWEPVPSSQTITTSGEVLDPLRMMLFTSEKARSARQQMISTPCYVASPW